MKSIALVLALVTGASGPGSRSADAAAPKVDARQARTPAAVAWPAEAPPADRELGVELQPSRERRSVGENETAGGDAAAVKRDRVPPPTMPDQRRVTIAVGLSPEAPGSKTERALLDRLYRSAEASTNPPTHVRRLRPGAGDARRICRERRDDLVIMIGYLPEREDPVLLAHDCKLDMALGVRTLAAADEPGLVGALWREREDLVREGYRERRRIARLGPRARAGIIAGVALVVVGVAVGLLVANTLRDEKVVLTVSP